MAAFSRRPIQADDVDQLLAQARRQLFVQDRHRHVAADGHDAGEILLGDDPVERLDDVLDVLQVQVVGPALVTGLRPAADAAAPRLRVDDVGFALDCIEAEHVDLRVIRIEHHRGVARVLIDQPHQRVEVRHLPGEEPVPLDRGVELHGVEEPDAGAGEDRQPVGRRSHLVAQVLLDARGVAIDAFALRRVRPQAPDALAERLADEASRAGRGRAGSATGRGTG